MLRGKEERLTHLPTRLLLLQVLDGVDAQLNVLTSRQKIWASCPSYLWDLPRCCTWLAHVQGVRGSQESVPRSWDWTRIRLLLALGLLGLSLDT